MKQHTKKKSLCKKLAAAALLMQTTLVWAGDTAVEVQENIDTLIKTNQCVNCNLAGADLNRLDLSGANLQGADLTNATFNLSDLSGADLTGAVLRGSRFGGADLANADLSRADLRGASIAGAYTVGAKIDGNFVSKSISDDAELQEIKEEVYIPDETAPKDLSEPNQVAIAKRKDFDSVPPVIESVETQAETEMTEGPSSSTAGKQAPPVKRVSPVGHLTIEQSAPVSAPAGNRGAAVVSASTATPTELQVADSSMAASDNKDASVVEKPTTDQMPAAAEDKGKRTLSGPDAEEKQAQKSTATVEETDLQRTPEDDIGEADSLAQKSQLPEGAAAQMRDEPAQPPSSSADGEEDYSVQGDSMQTLIGKLLDSKKCYSCDLMGADLSGKNLSGADLEGADLSGAQLEGTDFGEANLKGVSFRGAILKDADLREADLYKADFTDADLSGTKMKGAMLDEAIFEGAVGFQNAAMTETK